MKKVLQSVCTRIKRQLARIPNASVVNNILSYATINDNGDLVFQGKKIGHYDSEQMIGWCSLFGYIRILMMKRAMK